MLINVHFLIALIGFSLHICQSVCFSERKMTSIDAESLEFSLNLLKALSTDGQNLVVSPFSLSSALAMTLYGSRNTSGAQLSKILFGKAIGVDQYKSMVEEFNSLIDKSVKSNSKVLSTANFIYSHVKYPILKDFSQTIEKYFYAKSKEVDFIGGNEEAIKTINSDISEATKGKIPTLFEKIDINTKMILANALYFKGLWKTQFKTEHTTKEKFITSSNEEVEVDMMFQRESFAYGYSEELNCKAVELLYNESNIAMIVLLPNDDSTVKQLHNSLNTKTFNEIISTLYKTKVELSLPKFKLESTLQLIPVLSSLGIIDIFDQKNADFSGITSDPLGLYVGDVIQKAVIEVNEEGTEAAAATGIAFLSRSLDIPEQFTANRPFIFFMVNKLKNKKNLILFSGIVNNPQQ